MFFSFLGEDWEAEHERLAGELSKKDISNGDDVFNPCVSKEMFLRVFRILCPEFNIMFCMIKHILLTI